MASVSMIEARAYLGIDGDRPRHLPDRYAAGIRAAGTAVDHRGGYGGR